MFSTALGYGYVPIWSRGYYPRGYLGAGIGYPYFGGIVNPCYGYYPCYGYSYGYPGYYNPSYVPMI